MLIVSMLETKERSVKESAFIDLQKNMVTIVKKCRPD